MCLVLKGMSNPVEGPAFSPLRNIHIWILMCMYTHGWVEHTQCIGGRWEEGEGLSKYS